MYEVMNDASGGIHFFPLDDDDDYRNARVGAPRPRPPRMRPRQRPRSPVVVQPVPMSVPSPYGAAPYHPVPVPGFSPYPAPHTPPPRTSLDMRTGLKAIGAILPGLGKLLAAFRSAPERPPVSGKPDKDLPCILEFIAENFERERNGAQTASVLATTGAVMEILATL